MNSGQVSEPVASEHVDRSNVLSDHPVPSLKPTLLETKHFGFQGFAQNRA